MLSKQLVTLIESKLENTCYCLKSQFVSFTMNVVVVVIDLLVLHFFSFLITCTDSECNWWNHKLEGSSAQNVSFALLLSLFTHNSRQSFTRYNDFNDVSESQLNRILNDSEHCLISVFILFFSLCQTWFLFFTLAPVFV